jgi:hypothetical protein
MILRNQVVQVFLHFSYKLFHVQKCIFLKLPRRKCEAGIIGVFVQNKNRNRHLLWDLVKHFRYEFAAFAFAENQDVDFQNVETSTK